MRQYWRRLWHGAFGHPREDVVWDPFVKRAYCTRCGSSDGVMVRTLSHTLTDEFCFTEMSDIKETDMSTKCCSTPGIKILGPREEENYPRLKDVPEGQFFQLAAGNTPAVMIDNNGNGVHFIYCHKPLERQCGYGYKAKDFHKVGVFVGASDARDKPVILLDLEEATFRQRKAPCC